MRVRGEARPGKEKKVQTHLAVGLCLFNGVRPIIFSICVVQEGGVLGDEARQAVARAGVSVRSRVAAPAHLLCN